MLPKFHYESEMMRRNLWGKLDGAGIKAGDFIDQGTAAIVTVAQPMVSTDAISAEPNNMFKPVFEFSS